jgi:3-methyladenine DNA glycosylase/8-oxoguanine DNA glycosylase
VVRQRSAKPLSAGSIPAVASNIPTPPDFNFVSTVESHGWMYLAPFRWSREECVLRRREALVEGVVELEITHGNGALYVWGARDSAELRARVSRMFQLHVDLADFYRLTRGSPSHIWVEPAGFGRLLCGTTLWEDAVKVIATTNTMWRQTVRMIELLVAKCGRDGAFPSQEDVARFSAEELQRDCRLGYRARSIRELAEVDLAQVTDYRDLPGIGPYGAAHLLAMDGRHESIAVDTEFRRFVRERYHRGRKVSDAAMLRRYAKWGRWKYLAYWSELWESVAVPLQQPQASEDK